MCNKEIQVKIPEGIHARPASIFVKSAAKFKSKIEVEKDGKLVNGKSIIAVLSLGVRYNDRITLIAEGEDQADAIAELAKLFEEA